MATSSPLAARFRVVYARYADVREDIGQMAQGGLLVKVTDTSDLALHASTALELVLPDGTSLRTEGAVLHTFPGVGVAVRVAPEFVEQVRQRCQGADKGGGPARHERVDGHATGGAERTPMADRGRSTTGTPALGDLSHAEKIQLALHGNRDQRNAILRDSNRTLHPFVLKNPQVNSDDALTIAKNAQMTPEMLKMIADRRDWFQRPQIALALARNPKTPPDIAVRALEHVPVDALRHIAKGSGAMPHVVQAARKKVLR